MKVLPPGIAADPERLRLFEQEARAAGGINHPNILTIYDVGVQDGAPAAAAAEPPAAAPAVGDGQAGDGDGQPLVDDVEDPERVVAADGQLVGAGPLDVQALPDRQLVAGHRDGLADEAGGEDDRVAVVSAGDGQFEIVDALSAAVRIGIVR